MEKSIVYFIKEINSDTLIRIYEALGVELEGNIGIKVSTGEAGAKGYLKAELISPFVSKLHGTIIECNTAYPGARNTVEEHLKVAKEHGFTSFAEVDIMDSEGEMKLPVVNGSKHLKYDIVGNHLEHYDAMVNLSHFKGHMMGGYGAALKNQSIGIASRNGKAYIHSAGITESPEECWSCNINQQDFIESMAEAAAAVSQYFKENKKPILYINIMNAISLSCDCDANQDDPVMEDIGICASTDPVALDQACIDMVFSRQEEGAKKLQERIDSRLGRHILPYAESLKMGSRDYELISIQ